MSGDRLLDPVLATIRGLDPLRGTAGPNGYTVHAMVPIRPSSGIPVWCDKYERSGYCVIVDEAGVEVVTAFWERGKPYWNWGEYGYPPLTKENREEVLSQAHADCLRRAGWIDEKGRWEG